MLTCSVMNKMSKIITTEILLERIKNFRQDKGNFYDYSQVKYEARNIKIKIICPKHGPFFQYSADHIRGFDGCKECSKLSAVCKKRTEYSTTS